MKLSKVQKSAMMLALAVAMTGQVASATTNTRTGVDTNTKTNAATGTAKQSAQQAGQAQDGSAQGAARRKGGSFAPTSAQSSTTKTTKSSRTSTAPESAEATALKSSGMNLDAQATARVEKEMQTPVSAAEKANLEAQAALDANGPAAKKLEAMKDNDDFDTLVTSAVKKSGSWSAEVKGNLDFVLQRAGAYLSGADKIIDEKGNPIANPTRGQALRQAAKDLEVETAKKGADKKVVLNIRDISKWCK